MSSKRGREDGELGVRWWCREIGEECCSKASVDQAAWYRPGMHRHRQHAALAKLAAALQTLVIAAL